MLEVIQFMYDNIWKTIAILFMLVLLAVAIRG